MTTYEIEYIRTGGGERQPTDKVWLHTGEDGIHNITDAIEYFEKLSAKWGTYENRNAITSITVTRR